MRRAGGILLLAFWCTSAAGQLPVHSIMDNSVFNLHGEGEALWVGPYLNVTRDGGLTWQAPDADSLTGLTNRAYSIDVEGDVIWAGLGTERTVDSGTSRTVVDLTRGFLISTDGGATWDYRSPLAPADRDPSTTGILDLPDDTLTTYGDVKLPTLPITVPEQSPPWDLDYDPISDEIWVASQLAGLRRSRDGGQTWQRIVLPPDTTAYLAPELGYEFPFYVAPVLGPLDSFHGLNFQVFSVLVDGAGTVWAGTAAGLNRSLDGGVRWHHYTTQDGLTGNFVVSIEEQPRQGTSPAVWIAARPGRAAEGTGDGEQFGVVVTRDQGQSYEQVLVDDQPMYDFAFDGHRVYIAGFGGLFISDDDGRTFRTEREFYDPARPERTLLSSTRAYSVAITTSGLWVGTEDGLFNSRDHGETWRSFRADVPLDPAGLPRIIPPEMVPQVETYAYPNPFSPSTDRLVRMRVATSSSAPVTIRIFDYGMNLVRRVTGQGGAGDEQEVAWDGTSMDGTRVANGPYFYAAQTSEGTVWGKILVIE